MNIDMDFRTDPIGATEIWQSRYEVACLEFKTRLISVVLFRATLKRLGFSPPAIESEVNLHWPVDAV